MSAPSAGAGRLLAFEVAGGLYALPIAEVAEVAEVGAGAAVPMLPQCPGSAVASLGTGNLPILLGLGAMFIGAYLSGLLDSRHRSE